MVIAQVYIKTPTYESTWHEKGADAVELIDKMAAETLRLYKDPAAVEKIYVRGADETIPYFS